MTVESADVSRDTLDERRASYEREGYLVLRGVFSRDEIAALSREADELLDRTDLISRQNLRCRFQPHVETGEPLFEVFDPVADISPACARFAADRRIVDVVESLYGEPACVFKDKLIYKPSGARGYDLHQDFPPCWPGFPRSFVTVLIAIDPLTRVNGCTEVFPGYHRQGTLMPPGCKDHKLPADVVNEDDAVPLELDPGDVAIFGCFVPHRSAPNRSESSRRALFLSYNAASEGGEQRARHYREFREYLVRYLPGVDRDRLYFR